MSRDSQDQKIYPLLPSAPEDGVDQTYRLSHIKEIDQFLNNEIRDREKLYKKFHRCELVAHYLELSLTATSIVTGSGSIVALCTGVGMPISIVLGVCSVGASIATSITKQTSKLYNAKSKKHHNICIIAQTILDGITCLISKSIQNGDISQQEFETIMSEKQRYLTIKQSIRSKTKILVKEINAMQKKELIELGRQQVEKKLQKSSSAIQIPNLYMLHRL